jgi:hypothetical protein
MPAEFFSWQPSDLKTGGEVTASHVQSWRVILHSVPDRPVTADATLRIRVGDSRIVASGEGTGLQDAMEAAVHMAAQALAEQSIDLSDEVLAGIRRSCGLSARVRPVEVVDLVVDAVHRDALLGRLGVLISSHSVSHFSYAVDPDGKLARAVVRVRGDQRQVERVRNKLLRLIDVRSVTACQAPGRGNDAHT